MPSVCSTRATGKKLSTSLTAVQADSRLSPVWEDRLRGTAGEAHQLAAPTRCSRRKTSRKPCDTPSKPAHGSDWIRAEQRTHIVEGMLAEARRLFAGSMEAKETQAALHLLDRIFAVQSPCPEASFWRGLCLVRQQQIEPATIALTAAHEQAGKQYVDPAYYLGVLLYRRGKAQESLRYLAEANRVDASCPFVTCQMGVSLVAAGCDSGLALRALQRALGPRGFGLWTARPDRAWVEAFPDGEFLRAPVGRQVSVCLSRAGVRSDGDPAAGAVRHGAGALSPRRFSGSGRPVRQALAGQPAHRAAVARPRPGAGPRGRYDQAYKHLRIALEQEEPKDPFTAGYLALCGALGKPTNPEDKPRNVAWAIRLLARYPVLDDSEWAGLISAVHAEARGLNMPLGKDEQLQLCDVLASVHATEERAADAYAHLARTFPEAVRPRHAFLYVRAATVHGYTSDRDLDLFARSFAQAGAARTYFAEQQWNFEDAEYTYLERSAARDPGHFPGVLGAAFTARGEAFLLERSRREEEAGHKDPARLCVEVLLRLAPASVSGHDRLACLHYRRGDLDRAVALLSGWHRLAPSDHWPLVRQAIIEQERGNAERRAEAIDRALGLTRGPVRAAVAFLGARLALRETVRFWEKARQPENENRRVRSDGNGDARTDTPEPASARHWRIQSPCWRRACATIRTTSMRCGA